MGDDQVLTSGLHLLFANSFNLSILKRLDANDISDVKTRSQFDGTAQFYYFCLYLFVSQK